MLMKMKKKMLKVQNLKLHKSLNNFGRVGQMTDAYLITEFCCAVAQQNSVIKYYLESLGFNISTIKYLYFIQGRSFMQ